MRGFSTVSGTQVREYLYSQVGHAVKSASFAASTLTADSEGDKIVNKGVVVANITSGDDSGKIGPYDTGASDGRQTGGNIVGITDTYVNAKDGDVEVGVTYAGKVNSDKAVAKVSGTETALNDLTGGTKTAVESALTDQTAGLDITLVDPTA